MKKKLLTMYRRLLRRFGPQHWWPGETQFEMMLGAILTQNTAWTNVEKAILNLKKAKVLQLKKCHQLSKKKLASLIRPAGYFNIKADRIKSFTSFLIKEGCKSSFKPFNSVSTRRLRGKLLEVKGVGKETADSILLYALDRPVFVVDAYTKRILGRHGLLPKGGDYDAVQKLFQVNLPRSKALFNEYHALLVEIGKNYCSPKNPKCGDCPLNYLFRGKIPRFE